MKTTTEERNRGQMTESFAYDLRLERTVTILSHTSKKKTCKEMGSNNDYAPKKLRLDWSRGSIFNGCDGVYHWRCHVSPTTTTTEGRGVKREKQTLKFSDGACHETTRGEKGSHVTHESVIISFTNVTYCKWRSTGAGEFVDRLLL